MADFEEGDERGSVREQDRFLPIANISRIMKKSLPNNAKIAKDAKETVQECVSEFISFITSEASDKCQREKRKTINGDDLLWAMATLGFDEYVDPLKLYLHKYREGEKASLAKQNQKDSSVPTQVSVSIPAGCPPLLAQMLAQGPSISNGSGGAGGIIPNQQFAQGAFDQTMQRPAQ